ncbi:MAG: YuiB family protein [Candidatus Cohnella colombiensis]|uniref:YuiB family protein n=1 Tax=Candidatus Cohnella colombiensis TaxID=3121368 RepID=A0AA95JC02_9BACL|nr:MAG: YuiB family protein [Cohnella sp.]
MLGAIMFAVVGSLLCLVLFFGIGFILNMLIKTTWLPLWLFIIVAMPLGINALWQSDLSVMENIRSMLISDMILVIAGAAGAYMSGWTIQALRRGGYKMF